MKREAVIRGGRACGKTVEHEKLFGPIGPAVSHRWPGAPEHEPIEPSPELGKAWLEGLEDEDE